MTRGTHEAQQAFEGLALLVALRAWAILWKRQRLCLHIRSDNIGALTLFAALKGKGSLTLLAQEFDHVGLPVSLPWFATTPVCVPPSKRVAQKQVDSEVTMAASLGHSFVKERLRVYLIHRGCAKPLVA